MGDRCPSVETQSRVDRNGFIMKPGMLQHTARVGRVRHRVPPVGDGRTYMCEVVFTPTFLRVYSLSAARRAFTFCTAYTCGKSITKSRGGKKMLLFVGSSENVDKRLVLIKDLGKREPMILIYEVARRGQLRTHHPQLSRRRFSDVVTLGRRIAWCIVGCPARF